MAEAEVEDASSWRRRAELLVGANRLEEAAGALRRAIALARGVGDHAEEGQAEWALALVYDVESLSEASRRRVRRHLERAEAAFRRSSDNESLLDVLILLALRAAEAGEDAKARSALAKALAIDPRYASWWVAYTSHLTSDRDAAAAALRLCIKTIDMLGAKAAEQMRAECLRKLALITGEDPEPLLRDTPRDRLIGALQPAVIATVRSEAAFAQVMEIAERERWAIRSEVRQRELSASYDPLYIAAAALADSDGRYREAIDLLTLNTNRSFCSRAAMRLLWSESPKQSFEILRDTNEVIVQALGRAERRGGLGEQHGLEHALLRRREAVYQVEEELVRLVPEPHQLFLPSGLELLERRQLLARDDAVVVFAPFASGGAYVIHGGQVRRVETLADEELGAIASRFRALASSPSRKIPDPELDEASHALVAGCVDPLRSGLTEARRVFVIPSEKLWGIPLAALGERPLAETHLVAYVPNFGVLGGLLQLNTPNPRVRWFLGIADPDGTLPYAAAEVREAATRFNFTIVFVGDEIDLATVHAFLPDADVLHFACHGGLFLDYPELSYLHVAGTGDAREFLWAQDLVRIDLRSRLVVLAACDAGTAIALPGNEYVGLPAAFLEAGARTVIAPLWAVDDLSTSSLIDAFYDELAMMGPAGALWRAQTRLRDDPRTAHPYHWSAFQVYGLPRQVTAS